MRQAYARRRGIVLDGLAALDLPTGAPKGAWFNGLEPSHHAAGTVYIYRMLRAGILPTPAHVGSAANPKRPLAVPGNSPGTPSSNPAE